MAPLDTSVSDLLDQTPHDPAPCGLLALVECGDQQLVTGRVRRVANDGSLTISMSKQLPKGAEVDVVVLDIADPRRDIKLYARVIEQATEDGAHQLDFGGPVERTRKLLSLFLEAEQGTRDTADNTLREGEGEDEDDPSLGSETETIVASNRETVVARSHDRVPNELDPSETPTSVDSLRAQELSND